LSPGRGLIANVMAQPVRKTARLRFGRLSAPGAYYFVTFCTKGRIHALTEQQTATALADVLRSMNETRDMALFAATLMPDHVHLLFALGERLQVGQVIGKIKALSRKHTNADWRWQDESFEHQLRHND